MNAELSHSKHSSFAKTFVIGLSLFFLVLFVYLSIKRIFFPYELEWMEGWITEHALRIFHHQQLYTKPSVEFINWLYQPLYYYVTAAVMNFTGESFTAGRLVSFFSTLITCGLIFLALRRMTNRSWWLSCIGVGIYIGSFALTGYFYDLARLDSLFVMLLVASLTVLIIFSDSLFAPALSAFFLALAFFTKQQAFIFAVPIIVWFLLSKKWKNIIVFLSVLFFLFGIGTYFLYIENGEWYFYFVYSVPKAMSSQLHYFRMPFVFSDYILSYYGIGSIVIIYTWYSRFQNDYQNSIRDSFGLLTLVLIVASVQLTINLGDQLTYRNIAMPVAASFSLLFPVALVKLGRKEKSILPWIAFLQLLALLYNPKAENLIDIGMDDKKAGEIFLKSLDTLKGNILLASHAIIPRTKNIVQWASFLSFANLMAVHDAYSEELRHSWEQAFQNKRFDFIITDESPFSHAEPIPGYEFKEELNRTQPFIYRSRIGSGITSPRYIYYTAVKEDK